MDEKLRLDKYLWAIRIFKTRTQATGAISEGKVKSGGVSVKPSKIVTPGEHFEIRTPARKWVIEVTGLLYNRVSYEEAIKHYKDLTPEEDKVQVRLADTSFYTGKRQSKTGRPTKKQRRNLGDFFVDEAGE